MPLCLKRTLGYSSRPEIGLTPAVPPTHQIFGDEVPFCTLLFPTKSARNNGTH